MKFFTLFALYIVPFMAQSQNYMGLSMQLSTRQPIYKSYMQPNCDVSKCNQSFGLDLIVGRTASNYSYEIGMNSNILITNDIQVKHVANNKDIIECSLIKSYNLVLSTPIRIFRTIIKSPITIMAGIGYQPVLLRANLKLAEGFNKSQEMQLLRDYKVHINSAMTGSIVFETKKLLKNMKFRTSFDLDYKLPFVDLRQLYYGGSIRPDRIEGNIFYFRVGLGAVISFN